MFQEVKEKEGALRALLEGGALEGAVRRRTSVANDQQGGKRATVVTRNLLKKDLDSRPLNWLLNLENA